MTQVKPPREECLDPCNAWMVDKCGHKVMNGQGSCILDDPERAEQRTKRLLRKAMEART